MFTAAVWTESFSYYSAAEQCHCAKGPPHFSHVCWRCPPEATSSLLFCGGIFNVSFLISHLGVSLGSPPWRHHRLCKEAQSCRRTSWKCRPSAVCTSWLPQLHSHVPRVSQRSQGLHPKDQGCSGLRGARIGNVCFVSYIEIDPTLLQADVLRRYLFRAILSFRLVVYSL